MSGRDSQGARRQVWRRLLATGLALVPVLGPGTPGLAQEESTDAPRLLLRAARVLDVDSGEYVLEAYVLVAGARILEVGTGPGPANAERVDLGDVTLLPGFMDAHTHLGLGPSVEDDGAAFDTFALGGVGAALRGAVNARATVRAGFTTVREAGSIDFLDVALDRAIGAGLLPGPDILPSGYQISPTGGHGDAGGFPPGVYELTPEQGIADGVADVLRAVRYQIKHGARAIKVMATSGVLSMEADVDSTQYTDAELSAVIEEAARHGVPVAAHAHGRAGIAQAVRLGVDSIEHGSDLDSELIEEMKRRGTWLVPTAWINTAGGIDMSDRPEEVRRKGRQVTAMARASLEAAIAAGVKIAVGTDAGTYPHGRNAREFAVLVERGLSPLEAIRAGTTHTAELFRLDDRGRIAPGQRADLVAVPGDPLADVSVLESVRFVMAAGRIVRDDR